MGRQPSPLRIIAACAVACAAAAAPTLLFGTLALFAFPIAFIVAGGHMLVLGLPTYLVMRRYRPFDWAEALTAGFVIGMGPLTAWQLMLLAWAPGFSLFLGYSLFAGLFGLLAGAVFRAIIGPPVDPRFKKEVAGVFE